MEKQVEGLKILLEYFDGDTLYKGEYIVRLDILDAHRYPKDIVLKLTGTLWKELEEKIYD